MGESLFDVLCDGFAPRRDGDFLRVRGERPRSYGEVEERSARFAGALRALGVRAGDRVVVQVEKSADAIALYLACLRAGAVYVPLNPAYTAAEVAYFVEDAAPGLLVCRPEAEKDLAPIAARGSVPVRTLGVAGDGSLAGAAERAPPVSGAVARAGSDVAAMLYTSGTTGKPKGAQITHRNLASNARALHAAWDWRPDDVLLHALPVFHVHGLFVALHCAMLGGSPVELLPRFDADAVRAALPRSTVMMGVPTFYRRLLDEPDFGRAECAHVRLFVCGSAPLSEILFRAFAERTGHEVVERYGMTETGILTSNPVRGPRVAGSVGHPLSGVELRVVDSEGRTRPPGEAGEVEVRGPGVFAGYWNQPEKTRASFRDDGFFRTGDVGARDADGRLTLAGRSTDLIISGGYNVYPKEIELYLDEVDGVRESAVVGLPHRDFGEAVTAFVVRTGDTPTEDELRAALHARLARFKHPKRIFFVERLPRNAMGKVEKARLRAEHAATYGPER